jgi:hypothetical protein
MWSPKNRTGLSERDALFRDLHYHPLNMKKLGATRDFHETKKQRYGTRYGLTLREAGRIEKLYGRQLMLANSKGDSAVLPWLREFVDLED